jgi:hypothetical protein
MPELGDSLIPQYKFEWDDGTVRKSENISSEGIRKDRYKKAIEILALVAEDDSECEVTKSGYET